MELDPRAIIQGGLKLAERAGDEAYFAALCVRSGVVGIEPPRRVVKMLLEFERYGLLAGALAVGAVRNGDRTAVIDERGELTYGELHEHSNAIANAWCERGLEPGEGVAILARNHRGLLEAVFAAAKCGARIVLLNTSFAGPQIREVAQREGTDLLVYDDEYGEVLAGIDEPPRGRWRAWADRAWRWHTRSADRGGRPERPAARRDRSADHDPHQRHDRHAEGRAAERAEVLGPARRSAQQGAVQGA